MVQANWLTTVVWLRNGTVAIGWRGDGRRFRPATGDGPTKVQGAPNYKKNLDPPQSRFSINHGAENPLRQGV